MEILANFWIWWILAAILMGLEIFVPGAFMIWIGLAASLTGIFAWIFPGLGFEFQLLCFAVFSVVLAVIGRNYVGSRQSLTDHPHLNVRGAQYIGKTVVVSKVIKNGSGKVRVGDTQWLVTGPDTKEGESVKVIGARGTILEVEKVQ